MLSTDAGALDGKLRQAEQALVNGDFRQCAALADEVLTQDAINLKAHLFRGVASSQLGAVDRAIQDLAFVLERQPDDLRARFYLGHALRQAGQYDAALGHLQAAAADPSLRPHALFATARCLRGLGRLDKAIDHYRLLLRENPSHADAAANLAMLLEKTSQLEDAQRWAERALVLAPGNVTAQLAQAQATRRLGDFEPAAAQFERLLARELPPRTRVIASNRLGQCLDRLGRYDEAYDRFEEANRLQQATDPEAAVDDHGSYGLELTRFLRQWLRENPVDHWSTTPEDRREPPVFLIGFPRSGTTLLDRVLRAHPKIEVIEEQELLLEVRRKWLSAEHFPRLQQMNEEEVEEARRRYRQALAAAHSNPDARVVVDKLPLNSIYLPLIHRLFPEARILFAQRDPRDVLLSCFFQTFSLVGAMPYFLELERAAEYYDAVMAGAMDARDALPLEEMTVRYEDVVEDLEGSTRQTVEFLGLPWAPEILDYRAQHAGQVVNTPSYEQVSAPLYRRSVGRWRNYERQLAPVLPVLHPWVERLGYTDTE